MDLSYAINYIDMVGQYAEVDSFHLWLQDFVNMNDRNEQGIYL